MKDRLLVAMMQKSRVLMLFDAQRQIQIQVFLLSTPVSLKVSKSCWASVQPSFGTLKGCNPNALE